ncbi:hypothetical protein [Mycobacteroides chelonae]|uniref:hypothetical protein n=1 Tax=Mycobacteroides chelonae TaxID=1774 RepID=UPI00356AC10F
MSTAQRQSKAKPQRGDVVGVKSGEPDSTPDRIPEPGERVSIRLHGHPCTYTVRAMADRSGPKLTELTIAADPGSTVDYAAVRAVPVRRLAHSAVGWIHRLGGLVAAPGDYAETRTRPESADPRLYEVGWRVEDALRHGDPVRPTVAAAMNISLSTLDRLIAKARREGFLDGIDLPRRPQPQQRDTTED